MNFQPLLKRLQMVVYYLIMSDITFFTNIPIIIHVCKQKMSGTIKTVIKPAVNDFFCSNTQNETDPCYCLHYS